MPCHILFKATALKKSYLPHSRGWTSLGLVWFKSVLSNPVCHKKRSFFSLILHLTLSATDLSKQQDSSPSHTFVFSKWLLVFPGIQCLTWTLGSSCLKLQYTIFGTKNMLPSSTPPLRFQIKKAILAFIWWPLSISSNTKSLWNSACCRWTKRSSEAGNTVKGEPVVAALRRCCRWFAQRLHGNVLQAAFYHCLACSRPYSFIPSSRLWVSFGCQTNVGSILRIFLFLVIDGRVRRILLSGRLCGRARVKISIKNLSRLNFVPLIQKVMSYWHFTACLVLLHYLHVLKTDKLTV